MNKKVSVQSDIPAGEHNSEKILKKKKLKKLFALPQKLSMKEQDIKEANILYLAPLKYIEPQPNIHHIVGDLQIWDKIVPQNPYQLATFNESHFITKIEFFTKKNKRLSISIEKRAYDDINLTGIIARLISLSDKHAKKLAGYLQNLETMITLKKKEAKKVEYPKEAIFATNEFQEFQKNIEKKQVEQANRIALFLHFSNEGYTLWSIKKIEISGNMTNFFAKGQIELMIKEFYENGFPEWIRLRGNQFKNMVKRLKLIKEFWMNGSEPKSLSLIGEMFKGIKKINCKINWSERISFQQQGYSEQLDIIVVEPDIEWEFDKSKCKEKHMNTTTEEVKEFLKNFYPKEFSKLEK